jgi:uncharacterized protein YydD (DUF2326 family)
MIYRLFSDLSSFKEITFHPGLNVLIVDISSESTAKQTRNRAGKTSMIEMIHFLTGSDAKPDSLFRNKDIVDHTFGMEFDLGLEHISVERTGSRPAQIHVNGDSSDWPQKPFEGVISNVKWRTVLGTLLFQLKQDPEDEEETKWNPKFRSLFAYFVRRAVSVAFTDPAKQAAQQKIGDQQIALSYLLGLDWTISQQWQFIREKENTLRELRKAATQATFGSMIGTTAELRTRLAVGEEHVRVLKESVGNFRVLPGYESLETEASAVTMELGRLADDNTIDRQLLSELRKATSDEDGLSRPDVAKVYEEVGVALPGTAVRRFEDVVAFHESVIANRREYLRNELSTTEQRLTTRVAEMRRLDNRRNEIMSVLMAHGALDQFIQIQSEISRLEAETEAVRQQLSAAEHIEGEKTELDIERAQLRIRLLQDFKEQADVLRQAIITFEDISNALYEKAGSLTVSESLNGPSFKVPIHGGSSKGITNMQIFCFDIMLMRICRERGIGPSFLVHDSHLFDGVDARQIAKALQVGAAMAEKYNFQYIVTLNSDVLPTEWFTEDFNIDKHILPVRLTDATEDGGLFGFRFA